VRESSENVECCSTFQLKRLVPSPALASILCRPLYMIEHEKRHRVLPHFQVESELVAESVLQSRPGAVDLRLNRRIEPGRDFRSPFETENQRFRTGRFGRSGDVRAA
jgi:hypothetical protein